MIFFGKEQALSENFLMGVIPGEESEWKNRTRYIKINSSVPGFPWFQQVPTLSHGFTLIRLT
jgi:hypothetical protein